MKDRQATTSTTKKNKNTPKAIQKKNKNLTQTTIYWNEVAREKKQQQQQHKTGQRWKKEKIRHQFAISVFMFLCDQNKNKIIKDLCTTNKQTSKIEVILVMKLFI